MKEDLLQYAWQFRLYDERQLTTVDGEPVTIINVGELNRDAGPDFFNVKIKIGTTIWAGNVEIHLNASDWHKHGHDSDTHYNSVILHVVGNSDTRIARPNGDLIPQLELKINESTLSKYEEFRKPNLWIHCEKYWETLTPEFLSLQICRMLHLRLTRKAAEIFTLLEQSKNNWSEVLYRTLAKSFGMHTNAMPFEKLAQSVPIPCLAKHKDHTEQIEALFFGQAGLLGNPPVDDYETLLVKEYQLLRKKFQLTPIDPSLWKFARMRPNNSPYIRIAQFASLIRHSNNLFSKIIEEPSLEKIRHLLITEVSEYWRSHSKFGAPTPHSSQKMSGSSLDLLIINAVVPILYACSVRKEDERLQERAIELLERIGAEKNKTIIAWKEFGVEAGNAFQSQALMELKTQYCDQRKCLQCCIGHTLLAKK